MKMMMKSSWKGVTYKAPILFFSYSTSLLLTTLSWGKKNEEKNKIPMADVLRKKKT